MSLNLKLRDLFLLDQQMRGLQSRLDAALARQKAQQTKLDRFHQQRSELTDQHKQTQAKAAGFEHQVQDVETRIARYREQMNSVKSNKEYSALLIEVNTLKLDKAKFEEQALEQMGKVEALAADVKQVGDKAAEQQKLLGVAEAEVVACRNEVQAQLNDVTRRREEAAQQVPAEALATFNRLAHIHDGEAMAPVIEESRRHLEYSCGGCYMSIPVERVNALTKAGSQVVCCTNCGRILYLEQELKESMGIK
jgi:hypothetical protein